MKKHAFRWESLAFGLFFLAAAGNWAVWKQDILTPREFSFVASGVLITLGVVGVAATLWQSRPRSTKPVETVPPENVYSEVAYSEEGVTHEEADPQS